MMSSESRYLALTVLSTVFFTFISGRTWDMAIAVGERVDFLTENGTLIGEMKIPQANVLTGLAYDDTSHTILFSDNQNTNGSIFRVNTVNKIIKPECLYEATNETFIVGLVFDSMSRTLYWVDALLQNIMKMHIPLIGTPGESEIVLNLVGKSPRTIAIDFCNRHLYWGSVNKKFACIDRSNLDGSNRMTIIKDNLYEPVAVAVDHTSKKLYWIDDEEGIHYKIERSDLDGLNRELIFHGKHQQPVHISVDLNRIYWVDWVYNAVWTINKNRKAGNTPNELRSYYESSKDVNPVSVLTRDNSGIINCSTVFAGEKLKFPVTSVVSTPSFNGLTASTEESDVNHYIVKHCVNNGSYNAADDSCSCQLGFQGAVCEIYVCHNYCFQGTCTISSKGLPTCQCSGGFSGLRCERDDCHNYCLNSGECLIKNGLPTCKCKSFKGKQCELEKFVTSQLNIEPDINNIEFNTYRYVDTNVTYEEPISINGVFNCNNFVPVLISTIVLLLILVIILLYYVNKLRRRPRIRKRFIVSREGTTPLTSRPQSSNTQCEITIENCCNMNICETPCFEPKLRSTSQSSKKEEKKIFWLIWITTVANIRVLQEVQIH